MPSSGAFAPRRRNSAPRQCPTRSNCGNWCMQSRSTSALPPVNLPGFVGGEIEPGVFPNDPIAAARALRKAWRLGAEPIPHLVRTIENQGIVAVLVPFAENEVARIDAFSTLSLSRPIIVLSPDRANDIYRHRFTAAHELGHLVMHGELAGGDPALEREADRFAAEFLTPSLVIQDLLPRRIDFRKLNQLSEQWGVSIKSLIYRSREVGLLSDATARRAYIQLNQLSEQGVIATQPVYQFPGEVPSLLRRAVEMAEANGVTIASLAQELAWKPAQVRRMLGDADERPALRLGLLVTRWSAVWHTNLWAGVRPGSRSRCVAIGARGVVTCGARTPRGRRSRGRSCRGAGCGGRWRASWCST
jgi:Zn-dependent peptidase ImmA (M78 family)